MAQVSETIMFKDDNTGEVSLVAHYGGDIDEQFEQVVGDRVIFGLAVDEIGVGLTYNESRILRDMLNWAIYDYKYPNV